MKAEIRVKNSGILRALMEKTYHPILIDINVYTAEIYGIMITEAWREKKHENDVHGTFPGRADDLRYRIYTPGLAKVIEDDINSKWQYDPDRPHKKCAVLHAICPVCKHNNKTPVVNRCRKCQANIEGNWHFHIQVHPKTVRTV